MISITILVGVICFVAGYLFNPVISTMIAKINKKNP